MSVLDIVTPTFLKQTYLRGARTLDKQGIELPDMYFQQYLDAAASKNALELDLPLMGNRQAVYDERYDTVEWQHESWYLRQFVHRPVIEITEFSVHYGDYPKVIIPLDWIHISSASQGQVQVIPGPGSLQYNSWMLLGIGLTTNYHYTPILAHGRYTAGFEREFGPITAVTDPAPAGGVTTFTYEGTGDLYALLPAGTWVSLGGQVARVKAVTSATTFTVAKLFDAPPLDGATGVIYGYDSALYEVIACDAAVMYLENAANVFIGPVQGKNLGMDGLSQGSNIAMSAQYSAYSSWIRVLNERRDKAFAVIASKYRPMIGWLM